jgi:hypothetical protein
MNNRQQITHLSHTETICGNSVRLLQGYSHLHLLCILWQLKQRSVWLSR